MKETYLRYYEKFSSLGPLIFMKDAFFTRHKLRQLALLNRQKDYAALANQSDLFRLHESLNKILLSQQVNWPHYDYGEGYFYQGLKRAGITGFRNTESRFDQMQLHKYLQGKKAFDIGCNSGFLTLLMAESAQSIVGIDINPYLIEMAQTTADFFQLKNIQFSVLSFENYQPVPEYDVVLSFANHSTFDKNTKQDLESYFKKCQTLVGLNGILLFESHPPQLENAEALEKTISVIEKYFKILERRELTGGFLDANRTFVVAQSVRGIN
ncbi:MAG: class I SAM-dependent methyltransferase [Pseudobdellovibrionaceae bacterium]